MTACSSSVSTVRWRSVLFEQRHLTLVQAARLAGMTAEEFMSLLGETGVPAVDYPPEELKDEISAAL